VKGTYYSLELYNVEKASRIALKNAERLAEELRQEREARGDVSVDDNSLIELYANLTSTNANSASVNGSDFAR
jgi:hypothetical protein